MNKEDIFGPVAALFRCEKEGLTVQIAVLRRENGYEYSFKRSKEMPADILGLRTTIFKVPDLDAAKVWYAKAFEIEPYYDQDPYVGFNVAGYELGLFRDDAAEPDGADNVLTYWGEEGAS